MENIPNIPTLPPPPTNQAEWEKQNKVKDPIDLKQLFGTIIILLIGLGVVWSLRYTKLTKTFVAIALMTLLGASMFFTSFGYFTFLIIIIANFLICKIGKFAPSWTKFSTIGLTVIVAGWFGFRKINQQKQ